MKKIIADSGCDLKSINCSLPDVAYERVPFKINIGEQVYADTLDLDVRGFASDLRQTKEKTCSACPSPQEWLHAYGDADEIYVFTISGTLSGSYNSAVLASNLLKEKNPDVKIYILNTLSIGGEMALLIEKNIELLEQGKSFDEVCQGLDEYSKKVEVFFMMDNIDNLVNNGRMNRIAGIAVNLLGINIMIRPSDKGEVEVIGKTRGTARCLQHIFKEMKKYGYDGGKVYIGCSVNDEAAEKMCSIIKNDYPDVDLKMVDMSGLCCYYSSITGLMVGFEHN